MVEKPKLEIPIPAPHLERGGFYSPEIKGDRAGQESAPEKFNSSREVAPVSGNEIASSSLVSSPLGVPEAYKKIEHILEEDLADAYFKMTPPEQEIFKKKGEETARAIAIEMANPKFKLKKIVDLIRGWLRTISGINSFFLEQLAKIKTDKIIALRSRESGK